MLAANRARLERGIWPHSGPSETWNHSTLELIKQVPEQGLDYRTRPGHMPMATTVPPQEDS